MNIDALLRGSFIIAEDQSQQNSARPALRILLNTVFSHSFRALSPVKMYFSVSGKAACRMSAADSSESLDANLR